MIDELEEATLEPSETNRSDSALIEGVRPTYFRRARITQSWYPHSGLVGGFALAASTCSNWLSSSASLYIRSSGITANASSSRPGFSYLVGLTESVRSRLRNFSEAASWGGEAILGRVRNGRYDGATCEVSEDSRGACCEGGRDDVEACLPSTGEPERDRDCEVRVFNRRVLRSCSNWWVRSVALKALGD